MSKGDWQVSRERVASERLIVLPRQSERNYLHLVSRIRADAFDFGSMHERLQIRWLQQASEIPGLTVVAMSRFDSAILVEAPRMSAHQLQSRLEGAEVFEEHYCFLQRVRSPKVKRHSGSSTQSLVVQLDDGCRTPLRDVLVTAIVSSAAAEGDEGTTNQAGQVDLRLRAAPNSVVEELHIEPLHSAWPIKLTNVAFTGSNFEVLVRPLEIDAPDARNAVYGKVDSASGRGVRVGVIDTGIGPHHALPAVTGMNLVLGEPSNLLRDFDGHGTHVAGVIASQLEGHRAGESPAAILRAYRALASSAVPANEWDLREAVLNAAADGCHLINLSLAGGMSRPLREAIAVAWDSGSVCVVAAGNGALRQVSPTARDPRVLAITAIGLDRCWPPGAKQRTRVSAETGAPIGGFRTFLANFSNRGSSVALTAPGVGIVSTIHDDRWGVMDGTSMATPVATGVLARRLADTPAILGLNRDQTRSQAIKMLAHSHGEDILLHRDAQGAGLAR